MTDSSSHHDPDGVSPFGYGLVLLAGVLWSFGGLIVRQLEVANEWQLLFYRSIMLAATLLAFLGMRHRGAVIATLRAAGTNGVIAGLFLSLAFISYVFSLTHTTVANTLFLLSSAPFMAAVLGWTLLGEEVGRAVWAAMIGALLGIVMMVGEGVAAGGLFGDLTGLGAAFGFAAFTVGLRRGRAVEMLPAACLAGIFGAVFTGAGAITFRYGLAIPVHDLLYCFTYGGVMGSGLVMYTIGSRYVPSAELTLLSLTEVVLGPIWVWLAIGETPSGMTLIGGAIVLTSIAGLALHSMRRGPTPIGVV